jgi:energy-coupling factor transporter transmembrane protein EcfT
MWDILHQQAFLVGAMLVAIYQAAKFTELNLADPITKRYVALLPDANVRDFASSFAYHTALFVFLGVSLVVYFSLCQISPDLVKGVARLLSPGETSTSLENIPYPLYIAALFIGLSQPVTPIFRSL